MPTAVFPDRVQETSVTTGATDPYVLAGAVSGYRALNSAVADGDVVPYVAEEGANYEYGWGTFHDLGGGNYELQRTIIEGSSNGGAAVNWGPGTRKVRVSPLGSSYVNRVGNNTFTELNTFEKQVTISVASGTAPLAVVSSTLCANLNADLLDGQEGSYYRDAGNINAGTLAVAHGGTGLTSYTTGDLLYASGTTTLAKLASVATGNALISGGVSTAPSWGKIVLGTHTTGNYVATITGTTNQIIASGSTGNVTLSLPQNIHTTATPRFAGLGIGDSPSAGAIKLMGTSPQILMTCNDSASSNSEVRFVDSSTLSGRLIYAGGNPAGDRYFGFLAYRDRDNNALPIRFFTNVHSGLREAMRLETTGNTTLCVTSGTNVTIGSPSIGASASRVLGIANGTAPTTFPVVQLWAEAGELKVADTGGVVTQLSEHSRVAPDWLYDGDEFPERVARVEYNGYIQFVNITRLAKLVQAIAKIPDIRQALSCTEQQTVVMFQETLAEYNARMAVMTSSPSQGETNEDRHDSADS